jgi:hypothetical protein
MLCFLRDHQGHNTVPLVDYAKSCRVEILKGLEYLKSKSKELEVAKKNVEDVIQDVNRVRDSGWHLLTLYSQGSFEFVKRN